MNLKAIIVDDEPLGRERLCMLLKRFPSISICAECESGFQAVEAVQQNKPDIVFLDIQMPDLDGFGVIVELKARDVSVPVIIFVTAYNEHAVKAFEVNAIDYLLKPVQADRLGQAVSRVEAMLARPEPVHWQQSLTELLTAVRSSNRLHRIEVRSQGRIDYVDVKEVFWMHADGNYIEVHTENETFIARFSLSDLESQLDPDDFFRISRSDIVQLAYVRSIHTAGRRDHEVILKDGRKVSLKRGFEELQERLKYR